MPAEIIAPLDLVFAERRANLRTETGLAEQVLAERLGILVSPRRRHGAGSAQPILDILCQFVVAQPVSADRLVFDSEECGRDDHPPFHLEAIQVLIEEDKQIAKTLVDLLRHEARRHAPAA